MSPAAEAIKVTAAVQEEEAALRAAALANAEPRPEEPEAEEAAAGTEEEADDKAEPEADPVDVSWTLFGQLQWLLQIPEVQESYAQSGDAKSRTAVWFFLVQMQDTI